MDTSDRTLQQLLSGGLSAGTVGSECERNEDCSSSVAGPVYCDVTPAGAPEGRCRCPAGYRAGADRVACVSRRLTEPCRSDADCVAATARPGATECRGGRCACVRGRVAVSQRTCRPTRPGDPCEVCTAQRRRSLLQRCPSNES